MMGLTDEIGDCRPWRNQRPGWMLPLRRNPSRKALVPPSRELVRRRLGRTAECNRRLESCSRQFLLRMVLATQYVRAATSTLTVSSVTEKQRH